MLKGDVCVGRKLREVRTDTSEEVPRTRTVDCSFNRLRSVVVRFESLVVGNCMGREGDRVGGFCGGCADPGRWVALCLGCCALPYRLELRKGEFWGPHAARAASRALQAALP
jgi:hypothetical protein